MGVIGKGVGLLLKLRTFFMTFLTLVYSQLVDQVKKLMQALEEAQKQLAERKAADASAALSAAKVEHKGSASGMNARQARKCPTQGGIRCLTRRKQCRSPAMSRRKC